MAGLHRHMKELQGRRIVAEVGQGDGGGGGLEDLHLLVEPDFDGTDRLAGHILLLGDDGLFHHMLGDPVIDEGGDEDHDRAAGDDEERLFNRVFHGNLLRNDRRPYGSKPYFQPEGKS